MCILLKDNVLEKAIRLYDIKQVLQHKIMLLNRVWNFLTVNCSSVMEISVQRLFWSGENLCLENQISGKLVCQPIIK